MRYIEKREALNKELFIKRGKNVFHLICTTFDGNRNDSDDHEDEYITKKELLAGIYEDIDIFYTNPQTCTGVFLKNTKKV
jgi:hypothetical protein